MNETFFALALWNGQDPILKERLFGLTNDEGNHGEDVKEYYFYLDRRVTTPSRCRSCGLTSNVADTLHGNALIALRRRFLALVSPGSQIAPSSCATACAIRAWAAAVG